MAKIGRANKVRAKKRVATQKALTKKQAKAVTSIVKKVAAKEEETKFFQFSAVTNPPTNNTITSYNLFYHGVSQGTSNNQLVGDVLNWRGIKIKYTIYNETALAGTWFDTPYTICMAIVACKKYVAATSLAFADIRDDTNAQAGRFFLNDQSKILFKKEVRVTQSKSNDRKFITGNIWLKRNQKIHFKDFSVDYQLKDMNYYLVVWGYDLHTSTNTTGTLTWSWKNYFKDS